MSEFIVSVPDEAAEYFIARFGLDGTKMMGYDLTDEIVRCRDCRFAGAGEAVISGKWMLGNCRNPRFRGSLHVANVTHAGYCAWAERKEGGDD